MIGDVYTNNAVAGCSITCIPFKYGGCNTGQGTLPDGMFWGNGQSIRIPLSTPGGKSWGFSAECTASGSGPDEVKCYDANLV